MKDSADFDWQKLTFGVLQWVPVSIILWIATAISLAAGTYCINSNNIHFTKIWVSFKTPISLPLQLTSYQITIIRTVSTFLAIASILQFYRRSKSLLKPRGAFKQLVCFKIIVFLNFLQTLVFSLLVSQGDLKPNKFMTYNDISKGLPALILCCELALVSPFFLLAFPVKPYKLGHMVAPENLSSRHDMTHYQGGPLGVYAIVQAVNVVDLVMELVKGTKAKLRRGGGHQYVQPGYVLPGYNEA
jgi:hypothetical protein